MQEAVCQALVPRLVRLVPLEDAVNVARTCRTARAAVEAQITVLAFAGPCVLFRGLRPLPCLRDVGTRFAAVRELVMWVDEGLAYQLSALGLAPLPPGVRELTVQPSHYEAPVHEQDVLGILAPLCPALESVHLRGGSYPSPAVFAALRPATATLARLVLDGVTGLDPADVEAHLLALMGLTALVLPAAGSPALQEAYADALPRLTALEGLQLRPPLFSWERGASDPFEWPLPLAPLRRLRDLSLSAPAALAALEEAAQEGAALSALTCLHIAAAPFIDGLDPDNGDDLAGELLSTEVETIAAVCPALATLDAGCGFFILDDSPAALPSSVTALALGPSHAALPRLAPGLRRLTVLDSLAWDDPLADVIGAHPALEEVDLEMLEYGCHRQWLDGDDDAPPPPGEDDLACLAALPRLSRLCIKDDRLLARRREPEWLGSRLCAWAGAWARCPALVDLELVVLAIIGAALGARLTRLSIGFGSKYGRDAAVLWGKPPGAAPSRALLSLPLFSTLRELELNFRGLGPLPLSLPLLAPATAGNEAGGGGGGARGDELPCAASDTAWRDRLPAAAALLAPLAALRPPGLQRAKFTFFSPSFLSA
ncbi:MAG: hypothetical protein J3K34DRAFT_480710 [Monoraphidium minutum]|nr:MAG: hypothetical protein J3K34DRAFT_480710 [Monoraphidium minutum]